ncbi:MAG: carbohydrate kinase [Saprospiraceae bacterium]|nr:carbohydrate kinase [Saprospiraceae bacterium]
MYLLGYDIGSSSVKVALVDAQTGQTVAVAQHPEQEMKIQAEQPDWAEQKPEDWWEAACLATQTVLKQSGVSPAQIASLGIAYQMHGLVCLDMEGKVLRPAIIWCDSRAVSIGQAAFQSLGAKYCLEHYLNSPGNFTASKLRWIQENEPDLYSGIHKIMLPGDYIAYRMSGQMTTTTTGLSEGVLWDYTENRPARALLEHWGISEQLLPDLAPIYSNQGVLSAEAAAALGLRPGIVIGYRAGDQPNNALSLNVLQPGELAATGGTSGVVYAVSEKPVFDPDQRINSFAHVNYTANQPNTGLLLCINGAGSLYRWLRELISEGNTRISYTDMEQMAARIAPGAEGLSILPFGNGAERMLQNQNPGASVCFLNVNRHGKAHMVRAGLEGIAFAFLYGIQVFKQLGVQASVIRVGNDNLFQSKVFATTIANLSGLRIDVYQTTGAVGAAKASGVSAGLYPDLASAMSFHLEPVQQIMPEQPDPRLEAAYERWLELLPKPV